jgi:hypothetical protein
MPAQAGTQVTSQPELRLARRDVLEAHQCVVLDIA